MTLRIERYLDGSVVVFHLSGQIELHYVQELKAQIKKEAGKIALDLQEIMLVDVDAVRFLGTCEAGGVELRKCSRYIRQWIQAERKTNKYE